ncbi:glucokinase [Streptomonospora nanhaiensis]|uniref:Glucokinase n=1 Tax=Streptomonospora nanhaiensis TaxID=1323731 RepID=A0A853BHA6_9ACTN|nr:glucokinase [Streptomonospora nanhaiensis]NYI94410.1 glucokinase [Streptomonospora nanhaiensis]
MIASAARVAPPSPHRPWLVADIGGTNARFGLLEAPGARPARVARLEGADHADLAAAATAYLAGAGAAGPPAAACVAVAGPVTGDRVKLTNSAWDFSVADTRHRLGLAHLEVVNDFAALAMALPRLEDGDIVSLGGPPHRAEGPKAVLGPGTGLGVAGLVPVPGGGWVPVSGEGGHVDVPAVAEREVAVVELLRAEQGTVTAECLLCGPGLARLHGALARLRGLPDPGRTAAQICAERGDPLCAETLEVFCDLLGGFAGNAALTLGATGGVYLGGGILPRITALVQASGFRRRFEEKQRMTDYLKGIATSLIVARDPALLGAAARLEQCLDPQGDAR